MKKLMLGIAVCACESVFGMLMPTDGLNVTVRTEERKVAKVGETVNDRALGGDESKHVIYTRKIDRRPRIDLDKGIAKVQVNKYSGEDFEGFEFVDFPLIRIHRDYYNDFEKGLSFPIEELSTKVVGIENADITGKLVIDDRFINTQHPFPHKKINIGRYKMDDENLKAYPYTEIYINVDGSKHIIDGAKVRSNDSSIAYTRTSQKARRQIGSRAANGAAYQSVDISEEYERPDGTKFMHKRTQKCPIKSRSAGYEHNFYAGTSYEKMERYVLLDGEMLSIDCVTSSRSYPHMHRTTGYRREDHNLRAESSTEIYISTPSGNRVIDGSKYRGSYIDYIFLGTDPARRTGETWFDGDYNYYRTQQESRYRRPDGSIFIKTTQDVEWVMKPKPPAPVLPAQQSATSQHQPGGGVSNDFERLGHAISDCTIV